MRFSCVEPKRDTIQLLPGRQRSGSAVVIETMLILYEYELAMTSDKKQKTACEVKRFTLNRIQAGQ